MFGSSGDLITPTKSGTGLEKHENVQIPQAQQARWMTRTTPTAGLSNDLGVHAPALHPACMFEQSTMDNIDPQLLTDHHQTRDAMPYPADPTPTMQPAMPFASVQQPVRPIRQVAQSVPDSIFWNTQRFLNLPNGQVLTKTNYVLFHSYPDLQEVIGQDLQRWRSPNPFPQVMNSRPVYGYQGHQRDNDSDDGDSDTTYEPQVRKAEPAKQSPVKKATRARSRVRVQAAEAASNTTLDPFTPDASLDSPSACREYLAYLDPADTETPTIANDDWKDVKEHRIQEFVGQFFDVLPQEHGAGPPEGVRLAEEKMTKYHEQQDGGLLKIKNLLQTASQIKGAKARCYLLFDAVVAFHERGVPKELYDKHQWYLQVNRKPDRTCRLDFDTICSARMLKVAEVIKANKLVALDVLQGKNLDRFAQDPKLYLIGKFEYLKSNTKRQDQANRLKATKRARKDEDLGETEATEDDEDEFQGKAAKGRKKRMRTRRS